MAGVNGLTGAYNEDLLDDVAAGYRDRLLTPPLTRPLRPEYGSVLPTLAEWNFERSPIAIAIAAAGGAEAHRFAVSETEITPLADGDIQIRVNGSEVV